MRKKGSITVFLSFMLVLMISFVSVTLEAARVVGGMAYVKMISIMAGDSVKAGYYYPLFQQYGLLGVLAQKDGRFSDAKLTGSLEEDLVQGLTQIKGGLLAFEKPSVEIVSVKTILSDSGENFLKQLREEVLLEGGKELLSGLFAGDEIAEATVIGEIYHEQDKVFEKTATVTQEILHLMELCDGIETDENGLCFDSQGRLKTKDRFVKRLVTGTEEEWKKRYENPQVYEEQQGRFYYVKERVTELLGLMHQGVAVQAEVAVLELEIGSYRQRQKELLAELELCTEEEKRAVLTAEGKLVEERLAAAADRRDACIEWMDIAFMDMEEQYMHLRKELSVLRPLLTECLAVLSELEVKQAAAQISVTAYESFLQKRKERISDEVFSVFEKELEKMKLYTGLDEAGYRVPVMRRTIEQNLIFLEENILPEFASEQLLFLTQNIEMLADGISNYSTEGLWFSYGTIVAPESTEENILHAAERLLNKSILALVGISEDEISVKELEGTFLPSGVLEKEQLQKKIRTCFQELSALYAGGGLETALREGIQASADGVALECYARKYFGCYGREKPHTRLSYEREYLLFGEEADAGNLRAAVLYITAVRSIFTMASILTDAERMGELEQLALGVAGFTGMPGVVAAVKYSLLFLWSTEEALVDVAALLDGKRLPVFCREGNVKFSELFLFTGSMAKEKAEAESDHKKGLAYEDYLTLLSVLQSTSKKIYRSMDLIQENIRCRYEEDFYLQHVVTGVDFRVETGMIRRLGAEEHQEEGYPIVVLEAVSY